MEINEQNKFDVSKYLIFIGQTKQNCPETIKVRENQLRYLLKWSENIPLPKSKENTVSFPQFICNLKMKEGEGHLSSSFIKATLNVGRLFFNWAIREFPERYANVDTLWIESLKMPLYIKNQKAYVEHEYYTLEDLLKISSITPFTIAEKRGQAAMSLLFLSGMRVGAFLTLPISCVDLVNMRISQIPSLGVWTKFHKASITGLLNIPQLLEVVRNWDNEVRTQFSPNQTWYAPIRPQRENMGFLNITDKIASPYRSKELRREMTALCHRAGICFHSAHKLRHGHAVYGIKNAKNIQELKALSQNLMHSSIAITDGIYGNLSGSDFTNTIKNLGKQSTDIDSEKVNSDLIRALIKLQENPNLLKVILSS